MKFYLLWSFTLLLKLLLAWQLQLFGDEAFYAWEAAKPAWAYSDLPGMTAWLIRAGIEAGGYSPFAARLAYVLLGALLPFLIIRIARHFSGEAHAWQAGILSCCLPLLLPVGLMALPEAPLCLAALLCLDAALRLQDKCSSRDCIQLALGLAIGACTHYRFAIILLAGGLGFLLSGGWRQFRNPKLLSALLVGACAWLPLFFYNQQHDFAGWQFQFQDRNPWEFSGRGGLHLPLQAIIVTPILYALLLWGLWRVFLSWRSGEKKMGIILGAAGLPIMLFAGLAFFADQVRTSFHWPLQAYLALIAVLPYLLSGKFPSSQKKTFAVVSLSAFAGVAIAAGYFLTAIIPGTADKLVGKKAYPDNFVGWNEVSIATRELLQKDEILVADNFMLAAQLHFAFGQKREVYVLEHPLNHKHGRARQLHDWSVDNLALSKLKKNSPILIVVEETATKEWLRDKWRAKLCDQFDGLKFEKIVYGPGKGKSFSIFRGRLGSDLSKRCDTRIASTGF
ncbi:MAG: ArnT family glycosyltransferase [Arenimonas sp.]